MMRLAASVVAGAGLALVAGLALPARADAAINDCPGPDGFKVYLDKPSITGTSAPSVDFVLNELLFAFDQQKEQEWVNWLPEGNSGSITFLKCMDRQPSIDGSDFDESLVRGLYNNEVLVELVTNLQAVDADTGVAYISFVVVPLRQLHFEFDDDPSGLVRVRIQTGGQQADFIRLLTQLKDVERHVATGLGVKAARQGRYEAGQRGLCQGLAALGDDPPDELVELLTGLASQNLADAHADGDYEGPLRLLDPTRPCPEPVQ
jgi:hypothetical protein